jgi:hypothetical protein
MQIMTSPVFILSLESQANRMDYSITQTGLTRFLKYIRAQNLDILWNMRRGYRKRHFRIIHPALVAVLALYSSSASAADGAWRPRFYGETGGTLRFPNTLQLPDRLNAIGVTWIKGRFELYKTARSSFNLVAQGTYSRDTKPFVWNNSVTYGLGAELSVKLTENLRVKAIARHDWYIQSDGVKKESTRYYLNYSFFKNWLRDEVKLDEKYRRVNYILAINGSLAVPSSLNIGDNNVLLTSTAELLTILRAKEKKISFTPYAKIDFSMDRDGNNYNNKVVPSVGLTIRYPLEKGQVLLGASYGADFRWIDGTRELGPSIFLKWNKGW